MSDHSVARRARTRIGLSLAALVAPMFVGVAVVASARHAAAPAPIIVSPAPGTRTASVSTQISLLGRAALDVHSIRVVGSRSGVHAGTFRRYVSAAGESFLPKKPFVAGERVSVRVGAAVVGAPKGRFSFRVAVRIPVEAPKHADRPHVNRPLVEHFASDPGLDIPAVTISHASNLGGRDLLMAPKGSVGNYGPLITDATGAPIWFKPLGRQRAFDLNEQTYRGQTVLTWWQGTVVDGHGVGEGVIYDRSYHEIATVPGGNGFKPDLHEFQLSRSGTALVTSYQAVEWDMRPDHGVQNGRVWDGIVQEIDVPTGLVMYEWHSLDHVGVQLSDFPASKYPTGILDYFHVNSIQRVGSGNLLVSGRNTSAAYLVSPHHGGAIEWELGGKQSSFAMGSGATFWLQHDVRQVRRGVITIFDNEAAPQRLSKSRALTLAVDTSTHTARVLSAIEPPLTLLGAALGNVQVFPNGNRFISWGTTPYFSEQTPSGAVVYEGSLPRGDDTYRVYAKDWSATPTTRPLVSFWRLPTGASHGAVSWNGATAVHSWRVLAMEHGSYHPVATAVRSGFETRFTLPATDTKIIVQALDATGHVLKSSLPVTVTVHPAAG